MKNSVFKTALITSIFLTMNLAVAAFATPIVIDFDTDQDGSPLSAGTEITNQYDDLFTLSVYSTRRGTQNAMIFDTGNYTGGDDDLDLDIGNAIIISEDGDSSDPDDEAGGGKFIFDFTNDITAFGFTILDIENPGGASITLFDSASSSTFTRLLSSFGLSGWGDSSVVAIAHFETSVYGFRSSPPPSSPPAVDRAVRPLTVVRIKRGPRPRMEMR